MATRKRRALKKPQVEEFYPRSVPAGEAMRKNLTAATDWIRENGQDPQWDGKVVAFHQCRLVAWADDEGALNGELRRMGIDYKDVGVAALPLGRRWKSHKASDGRS